MERLLSNEDYITDTVFTLIADIRDPEFDTTLEDLEVVNEDYISLKRKTHKASEMVDILILQAVNSQVFVWCLLE